MDAESSNPFDTAKNEVPDEPAISPFTGDETNHRPAVTFMGNTYDLTAVAGAASAAVTIFACGTCGFGFYCLPLVPVILGAIGLLSLNDAVDPDRTKKLSWVSVGVGALFLSLIALLFLFYLVYFGFIFFAIASESGSGF